MENSLLSEQHQHARRYTDAYLIKSELHAAANCARCELDIVHLNAELSFEKRKLYFVHSTRQSCCKNPPSLKFYWKMLYM